MMLFFDLIDSEKDKVKFEQIYNTYKKTMFYISNKILKDEHYAHDAVQMSFLKIIRNLDKIDRINSDKTKGFITIIVKNTSIDIYRKLKRQNEKEILNFEEYIFEGQEFHDENNELTNEIEIGILNLPEKYKSVFLLKYSHGLNNEEIANLLDISSSTVRVRLLRGKGRLRKIIEERKVELSG